MVLCLIMTLIEKYILENFNEIETMISELNKDQDQVTFYIEVYHKHMIVVDLDLYMEGLLQTTGIQEYNEDEMTITSYCEYSGYDVEFDAIDYINDHWDDAKDVLKWYLKRLFEESIRQPIILGNIKKAA